MLLKSSTFLLHASNLFNLLCTIMYLTFHLQIKILLLHYVKATHRLYTYLYIMWYHPNKAVIRYRITRLPLCEHLYTTLLRLVFLTMSCIHSQLVRLLFNTEKLNLSFVQWKKMNREEKSYNGCLNTKSFSFLLFFFCFKSLSFKTKMFFFIARKSYKAGFN